MRTPLNHDVRKLLSGARAIVSIEGLCPVQLMPTNPINEEADMPHGPRFEKLAAEVQESVREVSAAEAGEIYANGGRLIDVREADEFTKEHAAGAQHLSRGVLEMKFEEVEPDVNRPIVCYCGGGKRSALAVAVQ